MATSGPSLSAVSTGGPHSAMAASSHSAVAIGAPSHSADFLMATSAGLPMGRLTILNYFANCCFFLSYSTCSVTNPPPVISLPVSNSNHTSAGQVVVNETGVSFNIAASNPSSGQKEPRCIFFIH